MGQEKQELELLLAKVREDLKGTKSSISLTLAEFEAANGELTDNPPVGEIGSPPFVGKRRGITSNSLT
jgi:hypothetical protein